MTPLPPNQARQPAVIARWIWIIFAAGLLALLGYEAVRHGGTTDFFLSIAFLPWIVGPAAAAALLSARARSSAEAWLFLGIEAATVAWTAWLWIWLLVIRPDPQNAITMMIDPILQFAGVIVSALIVIAVADLVVGRGRQRPRVMLMTILAITSAILVVSLAWWLGYVRL